MENGPFEDVYLRSTPHPVTVTTRIITYLVGNPYKPSFATVTGWGVDPMYILLKTGKFQPAMLVYQRVVHFRRMCKVMNHEPSMDG